MSFRRIKDKKMLITGILGMALCCALPVYAGEEQQEEKIEIHFYYNEACASCSGTEEFDQLVKDEIDTLPEGYAYEVSSFNTFHTGDADLFSEEMATFGYDQDFIDSWMEPVMTVNGKAYLGMESIRSSIKEAYLTAGEDLFVYGRGVYDPQKEQTLEELLDFWPLEEGSASIVYFYRITCEECIETNEKVMDDLPRSVTVEGEEYPLQVIRINTRSGRNNEVIQAFFEAYDVPEEDQMVPIVFTARGYLAGIDDISNGLIEALEAGDGLGFQYPSD